VFTKILVPMDLTDRHQRALALAAGLAGEGAEVTLLHVIEVIPGLGPKEDPEFYTQIERMACGRLWQVGRALAERQIAAREEILYGSRAGEIVRYAQERGADLIVLTAPRFDPQDPRAAFATLSYKIGILAPCPVLLVK
jgi:nucleotide-binding universal stress UspA family protein